jgi:hypothetical protein
MQAMTRRSRAPDQGNGAGSNGPEHDSPPTPQSSAQPSSAEAPTGSLNLKEHVDRFGEILTRGLDLAEAGLSLGLTIVTTVGAAAQKKIFERLFDSSPNPVPGDPPSPGPPSAATEGAPYGVTNRVPLTPGSAVTISFSINNDSPVAPKSVALSVEGFAGQRPGASLPADSVRVIPSSAVIAPMDFEKFVLDGVIPGDAAPDVYSGNVLVASDAGMRIPVWLVVQPRAER